MAALGLSACDNDHDRGGRANSAMCINFNQARNAPVVGPQDGPTGLEDCVQRWAYSLAPSQDEAPTVADAVLAACATPLTAWNRQILAQPAPATEGASITTGQPTNPVAEHFTFARSRALFYVVQARAGRCPAPPAQRNDGAGQTR